MKILMVCLGNICRSPMAEGILRKKAVENKLDVEIDSAGTGSWHVGQHPDERAIQTAKQFGVDISKLKGRHFSSNDFEEFDKIFVMDSENYKNVLALAKNENHKTKIDLILNAGKPGSDLSVPDPYYGGDDGFIEVFNMIDRACEAIIIQIRNNHG